MLLIEDIKKWQSTLISKPMTKFFETWKISRTFVATWAMLKTWLFILMKRICITNDHTNGVHIKGMLITLNQKLVLQVRTLTTNGDSNDCSHCRH
jgi:hypothetical protein